MSDPLFFDPQECNADVHDFTRLLQRSARGHVLWEPCTVGHVGDCGQIRDGRFWKCFNVYESPPSGIPRLDAPGAPDELRTTVFENRDVLRSSESVSVSFHGGLPFTAPPATLSINAGISWDKSGFAFLGFGGRQRVLEVLSPPRSEALQRYLIQYEAHIRATMGVLSGDIVVLAGVTRAPAWMGGVARCTSMGISGSVSLDIGAISIDWGASVACSRSMTSMDPQTSMASWALTRGPAGWVGESSHVDMSTVVVSPIRVKRRQKIVSQLLNLLRNKTSSSTTLAEFPAEMMQNTARSRVSLSGAPLAATDSDTTENDSDDAAVSLISSESDNSMEDDLLSIVMQKILDTDPSVEAVAGSWEVVADFLETYPTADFNCDIDPTFKVAEGNIAFLQGLSIKIAPLSHFLSVEPDTWSESHPPNVVHGNTPDTPVLHTFQDSFSGHRGASGTQRSAILQPQGAPAQILGKRSSSWIEDDSPTAREVLLRPRRDKDHLRSHPSASSSSEHMSPNGGYLSSPSPPPNGQQQKTFAFIALPGNAVRKRPRRRYDEIERLYPCNWPDCNKSYGTLNHLNAHITMQRHGEKRSPNEFKEMRQQWRKRKKEEAALAAMQIQMQHASLHVSPGGDTMLNIAERPPSPPRLPLRLPVVSSHVSRDRVAQPNALQPSQKRKKEEAALAAMQMETQHASLPVSPVTVPNALQPSPIPPVSFWQQQQLGKPLQLVNFIPEPLDMPQQRLAHGSTLLTPDSLCR